MTDGRALRADAARNRARLVHAAAAVFAERGLDAPLEVIARRAGVSIGTLYNRFPNRQALIDAVLPDRIADLLRVGDRAVAADDPWQGLVDYLEAVCRFQVGDRGLAGVLFRRIESADALHAACDHSLAQAAVVIERAQRHGSLRADLAVTDLMLLTWANGRVAEITADAAPDAWRRALALTLDGLRAGAAHPVDQPPMTPEQAIRAMTS